MDNVEKKNWLIYEINVAMLTVPITEYIEFRCPWNASYRIGWEYDNLERFRKKITRCYGFKNRRGGPNRKGIK